MCSGKNCPIRTLCYRFTAIPDERQSFFVDPPIEIKDGKMRCEYYWGDGDPFYELNNVKDEQN